MKLLREQVYDVAQLIQESTDGKPKQYFIEGIFMQADTQNRNGRVYPKSILEKEVNRYVKEVINTNSVNSCGELNHPESRPDIDPERISHRILSLQFEGKNVMGRAKIMTETPCGKIVKALMDEGLTFGVSSRGLGSVQEQNGINVVQPDFSLKVVDIVSDPSVREAIVENIMESKEWALIDGRYVEIQNEVRKAQGKKQLEEAKLKAFDKFMKTLKS